MPELSLDSMVLVVVAALFTAVAAVWDVRQRRIPNKLTLPVFAVGLVYQAFHGRAGLTDAGLGFLVGFGTLFVLWMIGGGGGGDVKLMGALSVWLGFRLTLYVLIVSTVVVVIFAAACMLWNIFTGNVRRTAEKDPDPRRKQSRRKQNQGAAVAEKTERRVLAFAVPVAVATWMVLIWKLPNLS